MSGLKDAHLAQAYRLMHARGVTTTTLAAAVCTSRSYVTRVLAGEMRHARTWQRIKAHLAADEIALLDRVLMARTTTFPPHNTVSARHASGTVATSPGMATNFPRRPVNPTVAAFNHWRQ